MPAEWERHEATWLSWPHREGLSFPGEWTPRVEPVLAAFVEAIAARDEKVLINVSSDEEAERLRASYGRRWGGSVRFFEIPTNEPWCRDHGPTFVLSADGASRAAVCWNFNAWGGKYEPHDLDAAAGARMAAAVGVPVIEGGLTFEGGSIDADGKGVALVSEPSVVDPARNGALGRDDLEPVLRERLGLREVVWTRAVVPGDDTDGHIDCYARFVGPGRVLALRPSLAGRGELSSLEAAFQQLAGWGAGAGVRVDPLPVPGEIVGEGMVLPATYANFYVANGCVVVPVFGDPADGEAQELLADAFPGREVVALDARAVIFGQGGFHCLTQPLPAAAGPGT